MNHCRDCLWWLPNRPTFKEDPIPTQCTNLKIYIPVVAELGCDYHMAADALEVNVPQHTTLGTMRDPNPNPVDGPVEILIVTFGTPKLRCSNVVVSDLDWLEWCLKSIRRHVTGFQGVTIAHPAHESEMFKRRLGGLDVRLHAFHEQPGKGFLHHQVAMASAETFLPSSTKYVLTCDADCMFKMPTTPEHYFWNDKPYYIWRSWESLITEDPRNPGSKVVSDCLQWKGPTDRQLGFASEMFGMCMNTVVFPIDFFKRYRDHIENVHGRSFTEFMLDGRNEYPQTSMDFTAMGAYAFRHMQDRWHWFDVAQPPYPEDRKKAYWSHGGLSPAIRAEIEGFLA